MKPVVASTAYLLISHGSRDSRPQEAMNRLADLVRKHLETVPQSPAPNEAEHEAELETQFQRQLSTAETGFSNRRQAPELEQITNAHSDRSTGKTTGQTGKTILLTRPQPKSAPIQPSDVLVGTACLELAAIPLSEQIYKFGLRVKAAGVTELKLLPVFLMSGVHVMEDIPAEVKAAQQLLNHDSLTGDALKLTLCPHLGSHQKLPNILAHRLASVPFEGSLLVAHGSRRPKGNRAILSLGSQIGTTVAYWATPPDIESQVIALMQQGCQKLAILPYFLFAGGITDAITHRTEELAERFPSVSFRLLPTLGATDEIAQLAVELATQ